jgi:mannose/cellobiose epimerase-like protein (N-acyl-D-glucosamine 2-epimerase family)
MDELFAVDAISVDSPKVKWMKANTIQVRDNVTNREDETPKLVFSLSNPQFKTGYGLDEDDAIVDFAKRNGLKLWNES